MVSKASRRQRRRVELTAGADVVEIQFSKPSFKYKAGQWLFLQVPSVSKYQWHPFTITSCPFDPYVSVHIRQVGDFTRALGDRVGAGSAQSKLYEGVDPMGMYEVALQNGQKMPAIRIDGPYGAPAEDVFENEIAVLIGTGIGVTPWASILKNIWHMRNAPNPPTRLRRVEFIWVCRDTSSFEWFQALLSSLEEQSSQAARIPGSGGVEFLKIHTYLTQKLDMDTTQNIVLNSVGADVDPLTELKSRTNFGRPNFEKLFIGMRDGILNRTYLNGLEGNMTTTVGVYFCGPSVAGTCIRAAGNARTSTNELKQPVTSRGRPRQPPCAKSSSASGRNTSKMPVCIIYHGRDSRAQARSGSQCSIGGWWCAVCGTEASGSEHRPRDSRSKWTFCRVTVRMAFGIGFCIGSAPKGYRSARAKQCWFLAGEVLCYFAGWKRKRQGRLPFTFFFFFFNIFPSHTYLYLDIQGVHILYSPFQDACLALEITSARYQFKPCRNDRSNTHGNWKNLHSSPA